MFAPSRVGVLRAARLFFAAAVWLAGARQVYAIDRYTVQLKPDLVPDPSYEVVFLHRLLPPGSTGNGEGARIYVTDLNVRKGVQMRVGVIERDNGAPMWFADKNLDGEFSPDERFPLTEQPFVVRVPLHNAPFSSFPINLKSIKLPPKEAETLKKQDVRPLFFSVAAALTADLTIDGFTTAFYFRWNAENMNVELTDSWIGADVDHDGFVDTKQGNVESVYTRKEKPVFQVGSRYFMPASIDLKSSTAVIQEVPESEYKLVLLRLGATVPDFTYVGFDDKTHHLKERKSRFTILYFWATWCAFCLTEIPYMNQAYNLYPASDLRLIGLNRDEDPDTARKYIGQHGIAWEQAQFPSVKDLLISRMRIEDYPTALLLDESYRVISMDERGQLHIRNDGLLPALEKILGKPLIVPRPTPAKQ